MTGDVLGRMLEFARGTPHRTFVIYPLAVLLLCGTEQHNKDFVHG